MWTQGSIDIPSPNMNTVTAIIITSSEDRPREYVNMQISWSNWLVMITVTAKGDTMLKCTIYDNNNILLV